MSTTHLFLGIICLVALGCRTEPSRSALKPNERGAHGYVMRGAHSCRCGERSAHGGEQRRTHAWQCKETHACNCEERSDEAITLARSQLGIRELTGNNDGPQVEAYLRVTNLPKGHPWCAAFVSWVFKNAGYDEPRTAWSPALFPQKRITTTPQPADVLGIYSIRLKRIAHAGLVERRQNDWIISIEGNTNTAGSREGDGVYRKWRHIKTIAKFANWLHEN